MSNAVEYLFAPHIDLADAFARSRDAFSYWLRWERVAGAEGAPGSCRLL